MDESFSSLFVQLRLNQQIPLRLNPIRSTYPFSEMTYSGKNYDNCLVKMFESLISAVCQLGCFLDTPSNKLLVYQINIEKFVLITNGDFLCLSFPFAVR